MLWNPVPAGEVIMHTELQDLGGDSTLGDALGEAPRRAPMRGLARLAAYLRGKELLILGPGNTGKTKFIQYLRWATLDPQGMREMTCRVTKSPAFVLGVKGREGGELKVRRAVDTCGQVGPLQHALLVARRRPHVVIVMLDCSVDPRSMLRWLCLFCNALDSVLRKLPSVHRRLEDIVLILNKRDKIADREYARLHQAVRKALERFLTVALGAHRVRSIPVLECISVQTGHGTTLIDGVVAQLAVRLGGRLVPPGTAPGPKPVVVAPANPHLGPSSKPAAVAPANPSPVPSRPSSKPAATPSSPPARPQDQSGATGAPGPVTPTPARFRLFVPHPSCKSIPTPSSRTRPSAAPAPAS